MYILGIDTTGVMCSAALKEIGSDRPAAMKCGREPMTHLQKLMGMVDELLKEEKVDKKELAAVAASVGPGSFTGIRIGVSTARAIAQGLGIPCVAVPTLEEFKLLCSGAKGEAGGNASLETDGNAYGDAGDVTCDGDDGIAKPIAVIFNARRGQVYGAIFGPDGSDIMAPGPYMLDDVLKVIEDNGLDPIFYGDGVDAYGDRLKRFAKAPEEKRYQTADLTAELGEKKFLAGEKLTPDELLPDYMRESEAEQRLKDGSLEKMRAAKLAKFMGR